MRKKILITVFLVGTVCLVSLNSNASNYFTDQVVLELTGELKMKLAISDTDELVSELLESDETSTPSSANEDEESDGMEMDEIEQK